MPLPLADEIVAVVDLHYLIQTGSHFDGSHAGLLGYITPTLDGRFAVAFLGGDTVPDFRLIAAFFGVLTVALMVWLGRELGEVRIGIFSAAALAVMPWHIYFSRIFFPASEYLFLTILALCLELAALRKRSVVLGITSALAAAGSIYVYPVALVTTSLLMAAVLVYRWREFRNRGGIRVVVVAAACGVVFMVPYAFDHLLATDPIVSNANSVITSKLIWNHDLDIPSTIRLFLANWFSYYTPQFLLFQGDTNVAQSIQRMGEVGWILGFLGLVGIVVGVFRQRRADVLLFALTAIYPIADSLTYFDAPANSVRGLTGSALWAVWAGIGTFHLSRVLGRSNVPVLVAGIATAVALQSLLFVGYYFGPYTTQYSYAFETGYDHIYDSLSQQGLQTLPITLHAGYERDVVLEYFSHYRLRPIETPLACSNLPFDVTHNIQLPRIFIVREDRGYASNPACVEQTNLIQRDIAALLNVSPLAGEAPRKIDVIASFPNDQQGGYFTAILLLH